MKNSYEYELVFRRCRDSYGRTPMAEICVEKVGSVISFQWTGSSEKKEKEDVVMEVCRPTFYQRKVLNTLYPHSIKDPDSVEGKVCIYDGEFSDAAAEGASKTKMLALIVTKPLTETPNLLPVFCLGKDEIKQVLRWGSEARILVKSIGYVDSTVVSNQGHGERQGQKREAIDHPLQNNSGQQEETKSFGTEGKDNAPKPFSSADAASGNQTTTTTDVSMAIVEQSGGCGTSSMEPGAVDRGSSPQTVSSDEREILVDGDDHDFGATNGGPQFKKIKTDTGALGSLVKMGKSYLGHFQPDEVFLSGSGWNKKDNFSNYRKAMESLARMDPDGGDAKKVVDIMQQFLRSTGGNLIVKLAFAGRLWTVVTCPGRDALLDNILAILERFNFVNEKPDLDAIRKQCKQASEKPTSALDNFFADLVKDPRRGGVVGKSKLWANVLWLWMKCGLLTAPINWESWLHIRSIVGSEFWRDPTVPMGRIFTRTRLNTLALLLQGGGSDAHSTLIQLQQGPGPVRVELAVSELLKEFARRLVDESRSSIANEWAVILNVLGMCSFPNRNKTADIITCFAEYCSFRAAGSFSSYSSLVGGNELLGGHESLYKTMKQSIGSRFSEDLRNRSMVPPAHQVSELLRQPWSSLYLIDRSTVGAILKFLDDVLDDKKTSFGNKLMLLDSIRAFAGERQLEGRQTMFKIKNCKWRHTSKDIIDETFTIAMDFPEIFCEDKGAKTFASRISQAIEISERDLLQHLESIQEGILVARQLEGNSFGRFFADRLEGAIVESCEVMDTAAINFLRLVRNDKCDALRSLRLASNIFVRSFPSWRPLTIGATRMENKKAWESVFECFRVSMECEQHCDEIRTPMAQCHARLKRVFEEWGDSFATDEISLCALDEGLELSQFETWYTLAGQFDVNLPAREDIDQKIRELERNVESIKQSLVAPIDWNRSLADLLSAYTCREETNPELAAALEVWAVFAEAQPGQTNQFRTREVIRNSRRSLKLIRSDCKAVKEFDEVCKKSLSVCDYFLRHPSLLFQKSLLSVSLDGCQSVHQLRHFVEQACEEVAALFSSQTSFVDVKSAISTLESKNVTIKEEMSSLLGCQVLHLDKEMCNHFLLSALLCSIYEPLEGFLDFTTRFGFEVANSAEFLEVSEIVEEAKGAKQGQGPADQCRRLYWHLCADANSLDPSDNTDEQLACLEELLPSLKLLACLRRHPELWTLAGEKKWFGKEGLSQFMVELDQVSACSIDQYNTCFLEGMEPAIRAVSFVGALREESNLGHFLKSLLSNKSVQEWRAPMFELMQSNLGEIRQWFCGGRDEIAGVYNQFKQIITTGAYRIHFDSSGAACGLSLEYQEDGQLAKAVLNEEQARALVEQLAVMQHDDRVISDKIDGFLEHHSLICEASSIIIRLYNSGVQRSGAEDFECVISDDNATQVAELLEISRQRLEECNLWLQEVWSRYPNSLMFWADELRELHKLLLQDDDDMGLLVLKLSRLLPLTARSEESLENLKGTVLSMSSSYKCDDSWLQSISSFVEEVCTRIGSACDHKKCGGDREVVVHSIEGGFKDEVMLCVIKSIYKDRLPLDFEVLDGTDPQLAERLPVFLARSRSCPHNIFVVLNVEEIKKKHLTELRSFLTTTGSESIKFHCIQREAVLPLASPYFDNLVWGNESRSNSVWSDWRNLVIDTTVCQATLVVSSLCSSGKSHFIQTQQEQFLEACTMKSEAATVAIHEKSSSDDLMAAVASKFTCGNKQRFIHFSILSIPPPESELRAFWLQQMNSFFFSFFVLHLLHHSESLSRFHIGQGRWRVFVELPTAKAGLTWQEWLSENLPLLGMVCDIHDVVPSISDFDISTEALRVCTYLRAYEDGSINDKFEPASRKQIVFVLDQSESMDVGLIEASVLNQLTEEELVDQLTNENRKTQLSAAVDCALQLFDSHLQDGDGVEVILFNHQFKTVFPLQRIRNDAHKQDLRARLDGSRTDIPEGGGTHMFSALSHVVENIEHDPSVASWIVCLTDGDTDPADRNEDHLRRLLEGSPDNLNLIVIGVNLRASYETQMRLLANKYRVSTTAATRRRRRTRGFYVGAESTLESLHTSFLLVSQAIPVSQTLDLLGVPTEEECRQLIREHYPLAKSDGSVNLMLLTFWIRFIHRRVQVLDNNNSFNYNQDIEHLGESLMKMMLEEVQRILTSNQERDWLERNYTQLIYDFSVPNSPEFRLLCTSPTTLDASLKAEYERCGFSLPEERSMSKRETLDKLISQAMNIPLEDGRLKCIDECGFIITWDYAIKLLNIHERVASGCSCTIEGETGISKTALSKMYGILQNSALVASARQATQSSLSILKAEGRSLGFAMGGGGSPEDGLVEMLKSNQGANPDAETDASVWLFGRIETLCSERPPLFQKKPDNLSDAGSSTVIELVKWFSASTLETTFFELNVHSCLTERDVVAFFLPCLELARRLAGTSASLVVFLDEVNTASCPGLFKEISVDGSLQGERLPANIVVICACNPARCNLMADSDNARERDVGRSWTSGHYQVTKLLPSMECLKWSYGSLTQNQEREFVYRRLGNSQHCVPPSLHIAMTDMIVISQQAMREFAAQDIRFSLQRHNKYSEQQIEEEALARAKSVVSLRDIQRVFTMFEFFLEEFPTTKNSRVSRKQHSAMVLALAINYFFRLDADSRNDYVCRLDSLPSQRNNTLHFNIVLEECMAHVIANTDLSFGIAKTKSVIENAFVTLVCSLSGVPLMIVGPPGCSKTLSVNTVGNNANGEESLSPFYREVSRLTFYHYQCSKESTSKEIAAIFEIASRRQAAVDSKTNKMVVFMDEAGLPEEKRESLKVLHYLLERHMSVKGDVSFVTITNHMLDAAKGNRCVTLFRQAPDDAEMQCMTEGVLYGCQKNGLLQISTVEFEGYLMEARDFAKNLILSYRGLLYNIDELPWLDTFFGLRDYIYFLKSLRRNSPVMGLKMVISVRDLFTAIEQNFNGVKVEDWKLIAFEIMRHVIPENRDSLETLMRNSQFCPMRTLRDGLTKEVSHDVKSRRRFSMIIDATDDDSIMRLLSSIGLLDLSKKSLFKLSHFKEEKESEKLRLISGVTFAAMQGSTALLSQTESVDESFYDLQNQNFHEIHSLNGTISMFANIAAGGVSRRHPVHPSFNCLVHVRESQLDQTPAPFLNRFEKFRLDVKDVCAVGWASLGRLETILQVSHQRTGQLIGLLNGGFVGWKDNQSLCSVYAGLLPTWAFQFSEQPEASRKLFGPTDSTLVESLTAFLGHISTMSATQATVAEILEDAAQCLPRDSSVVLRQMMDGRIQGGMDRIHSALLSLLLPKNGESDSEGLCPVQSVCASVIQMIFTRHSTETLLHTAVPETMYSQRQSLPACLVDSYFSQEHFSLKELLKKAIASDDSKLLIAHTRTDSVIHSIPSYNERAGEMCESNPDQEIVQSLVCLEDELVIVEHLGHIQSESSFRKVLTQWTNGKKRAFLLLVDMSRDKATENVNFVRMCVEQYIEQCPRKIFVALLHYPASRSLCHGSYPALFLGKWHHVFLDGIGQAGPSLGLSESIRQACRDGGNSDNKALAENIGHAIMKMLPNILSNMACRKIFYKNQVEQQQTEVESFSVRLKFLKEAMGVHLRGSTLADILIKKFALYWLENGLETSVRTACMRLQRGTSHLSVSVSICSTLLEAFSKFVMWSLKELNAWRGLDLLLEKCHETSDVLGLLGAIMLKLPPPPFSELMLMQERGASIQALPQTLNARSGELGVFVRFPFFYRLSACIDEVLELAAAKVAESSNFISQDLLLRTSMDILANSPPGSLAETAAYVVDAALKSEGLFLRYLEQFVEWRACTNPYIIKWLIAKVNEHNIVAVHCVVRCCQIEFMKEATWSMMAHTHFPLSNRENVDDASQWPHQLLLQSLNKLDSLVVAKDKKEWNSTFASLISHFGVIKTADQWLVARARILCLFNTLFEMERRDNAIEDAAVETFYGAKQGCAPTLATFVRLIGGNEQLEQSFLWQFFSPFWQSAMRLHHEEDFKFLLEGLDAGTIGSRSSHQWKVTLLLRACTYFEGDDKEQQQGQHDFFGLSLPSMKVLNAELSTRCDTVAHFSDDGKRVSFPHFSPAWMRVDGSANCTHAGDYNAGNTGSAFYANYTPAFTGNLAPLVFDLFLGRLLHCSGDATSLELMQQLLECLDSEEEIGLEDSIRLTRLRKHDFDHESLPGSALAALIVEARTITFIAGLARDLACRESSALSEPYDEVCQAILQLIMGIPDVRFADFFFSQVLRHRGEGRLMQLLDTGEILHDLPWCSSMQDGLPTRVSNHQTALQHAEETLAEAVEDENRKARELKLCPSCSLPFGVAERNCGSFRCGRDYHGTIGREGTYGCGHTFQVDQAPRYRVNEGVLRPLRDTVEAERAKLATSERGASVWNRVRDMEVPMYLLYVDNYPPGAALFPTSSMIGSCDRANATAKAVQVLLQGAPSIENLCVLSDMIELYVWLHSTFSQLVTKEQAMIMIMGDLMKKERLRRRFDTAHVKHMSSLWKRLVKNVNSLLEQMDHKALWNCQEIAVPFKCIEEAPLIALLSEGDDPTDGFDFLFLLISELILRYNNFARSFAELCHSLEEDSRCSSINPKFLMAGNGMIPGVNAVSMFELESLVFAAWDSDQAPGQFDVQDLGRSLDLVFGSKQKLPLILEPQMCLREEFVFQDYASDGVNTKTKDSDIFKSADGVYFAREQDLQLVHLVEEQVKKLHTVASPSQSIRQSLCTEFHKELDTLNKTRAMLEGLRNLLELLSSENSAGFLTLGSALDSTGRTMTQGRRMMDIGFPDVRASNMEILLALDRHQVAELFDYLRFQLATEGYLYSELPVFMSEPIDQATVERMLRSMQAFCEDHGAKHSVAAVREFIEDVLVFYEGPTLEAASVRNEGLRAFLSENNFCGPEDPIFAMLPQEGVGVQHYVSLRQHLQQVELSFLHKMTKASADCEKNETTSAFSNKTAGQCWLWRPAAKEECDVEKVPARTSNDSRLWFLDCLSDALALTRRNELKSRRDRSACLIQKWWLSMLDSKQAAMDVDLEDQDEFFDAHSVEEMDVDEEKEAFFDYDNHVMNRNMPGEVAENEVSTSDRGDDWETIGASQSNLRNTVPGGEATGPPPADETCDLLNWLQENNLSKKGIDKLQEWGATTVADVAWIVNQSESWLEELPRLDAIKIRGAIRMLRDLEQH